MLSTTDELRQSIERELCYTTRNGAAGHSPITERAQKITAIDRLHVPLNRGIMLLMLPYMLWLLTIKYVGAQSHSVHAVLCKVVAKDTTLT